MDAGEVPKAWKDAEVTAIFKKGSVSDAGKARELQTSQPHFNCMQNDGINNKRPAYGLHE
jgi:hypothetical protein